VADVVVKEAAVVIVVVVVTVEAPANAIDDAVDAARKRAAAARSGEAVLR
jgi:hypothetical protein